MTKKLYQEDAHLIYQILQTGKGYIAIVYLVISYQAN